MKKILKVLSLILSVLIIMNVFAVANPVLAVEVQEAVAELEAEAESTTESGTDATTEEETETTTILEEFFDDLLEDDVSETEKETDATETESQAESDTQNKETEVSSTESDSESFSETSVPDETTEEAESETVLENEILTEEPEIADEIVSLRDEYTKYFRRTDGTYIAAKYANPVHFLKDGEWVEYDFTLTQKQYTRQVGKVDVLVPSRTDIPVQFPAEISNDSNNAISIGVADTTISFAPKTAKNDIKNSTADIANDTELVSNSVIKQESASTYALRNTESQNKDNIKNKELKVRGQKSSVKYDEVFDNVSLEYELSSNILKESIVLNEKQNRNVFEFTMDLGGLFPQKEQDGSIVLYEDAEFTQPKSQIMAPYMLDSAGEYSDDVLMDISPDGDKYTLTVTADKIWLNDKARVYPVIIDPTIRLDINRADTIDCYVDKSQPNTSFPMDSFLYAGHSTLGLTRTFIQFNLPDLPDDCAVIQNASLNFYQLHVDAGSDKRFITAHKVTEEWNNDNLKPTWNDQPTIDNTVLDYAELTYDVGDYYSFDITRTAKEWFEGAKNYGICLKGYDETKVGRVRIISAEYNSSEEIYPAVTVTYRNNKGLEGYWSYSGFSAGTAGSASVNDYTGNLVYQIPLISTTSEIMPVSLSLIHNTYSAKQVYSVGKDSSVKTTAGKGWRLNMQETILPSSDYGLSGDNAKKYPYVYTDGDGTEHYIQKVVKKDKNDNDVTTYEDEDGLGLTFEKKTESSTTTYTLTDKMDNVRTFNSEGNLIEIKNANNQTITITYTESGKKLNKITDGTGHTLTFGYYKDSSNNELDYVKTITDNANRTVQLITSSSKLNGIIYPDTNIKTYIVYETQYTNNTDLIDYVWSVDGTGLRFDYKILKDKYPSVSAVREFAATNSSLGGYTQGQIVYFDRAKYNTTVIRSGGIDGITYDESTAATKTATQNNQYDDIVTTLQFDNTGRPVSQQVSYGNGTSVGAGAYNYTSTTNTSDSKNKIADAASLGKNTVNMLTNGGCEGTTGWTQNKPSNLNSALYEITGNQYAGGKALAINNGTTMSVQANTNFGQVVNGVTAGKTYTFSAFVRTADIVKTTYASAVGYSGAYLQITARNSNGANIDSVYSQVLTTDTDTAVNGGWRRLTATYELPAGTTSVAVYMCLRNAAGKAYFDNAQLELGSTPNSVNLLENSSFEKVDSNNYPTDWDRNNLTSSDINDTTVSKKDGSKLVKINGNVNGEKSYSQTIDVQGNPNDTYIVSGWAAAYAVSSNYHSHYTNKGEKITDKKASEIFESVSEEDDKDVKAVEDSKFEIDVSVIYKDENGNTTEPIHKASAKFNTSINIWQYSSAPVVLKYVDDKYSDDDNDKTYTPYQLKVSLVYTNQANYAFFDHIQLVKDVAQSYTYDDEGNVVSVSANAEQKNDMSYDPDSNDLKKYTDAGGNTTTFDYEENTHNLTKVTSPKGVKTQYTYDKGLNTSVENVSSDASLKSKTTKTYYGANDTYGIKSGAYLKTESDQHGNVTTYTYDWKTGTPLTTTDANGNVTRKTYTDTNYSKLQTVTTDVSRVTYDYTGNKVNSILFSYYNTPAFCEEYNFEYDVYGNVKVTSVGDAPLATNTYGSHNGMLQKSVLGNDDAIKYGYDYSGNVVAEYHKDASEDDFGYAAYTWQYSSNGNPRIHKDGYNSLKYVYSYDAIGRLIRTDISNSADDSAVGSTEFGYNTRGHLVSVANEIGGNSYKQYYSYSKAFDNSGNEIAGSYDNARDGLCTRYSIFSGRYADYTYDGLNRVTQRKFTTDTPLTNIYTYKSSQNYSGYTTSQLSTENINGALYAYSYDDVGNITGVTRGGAQYHSYAYDAQNRLVRDNSYTSGGGTYTWSYDALGNIRTKKTYAYTTGSVDSLTPTKTVTYNYGNDGKTGWNYLLTSVDLDGNGAIDNTEKISYDSIGNPTSYLGAVTAWNGRQMIGYAKDGNRYTMTYDADGLRGIKNKSYNVVENGATVTKTEKTTYQYVGDKLYYENRNNGKEFYYFYDNVGHLSAIAYHTGNTVTVFYVSTNMQGDVISIHLSDGTKIAQYDYDAWGKATIATVSTDSSGNYVYTTVTESTAPNHIATLNPIRYRGYYYDSDLGLYYLQSRYYDANIGRFINADDDSIISASPAGLIDKNLFSYCDNNPVVRVDAGGEIWATLGAMAIGGVIGAAVNVALSIAGSFFACEDINWKSVGVSALSGFVSGAVSASPVGRFGQALLGAAIEGVTYAAERCVNGDNFVIKDFVFSTVVGGVSGFVGGPGANHNMNISNTLDSTKSVIQRESRRANQKYAQKAVNSAKYARGNYIASTVARETKSYTFWNMASNKIKKLWEKWTS